MDIFLFSFLVLVKTSIMVLSRVHLSIFLIANIELLLIFKNCGEQSTEYNAVLSAKL